MTLEIDTIGYAFVGGLLPALVWLFFLLKEEERCPQPRWAVFLAFLTGMIAVPLVIPFEDQASRALASGVPLIVAWATIEETAKYALAAMIILWRKSAIRNPIDVVATMLTVALGFAAVENALFLIDPLSEGRFLAGFVTNNLRFIGSTLLHVMASSTIGFALAFSYTAGRPLRAFAASLGLILSIALHAAFNFFIIQSDGSTTILAFFLVWTAAIVFFATFEILKYFRYRALPKNTC
ncbi:MAG: PrsW family glutamic-type intramembrane protease [Minisyncoccia bacterium]